MAKNPPDERLVYLAFKNIFKGQDAQLRTSKKIRTLIEKHAKNGGGDVHALVAEHNVDNVYISVKALLREEIFESTLRAKIRFPEVFEVSPAQSAVRVASEAEAARSDADAIRGAAGGNQNQALQDPAKVNDSGLAHKGKGKATESQASTILPQKRSCSRANVSVPSLYPVYLPLNTQHRLLVKVQATLEDACYAFGLKVMPDVLLQKGWDCPESVELNIWAQLFRSHEDKFETDKLHQLGRPFPEFLESIAQLRHTAVHRIRVSANMVGQFMTEAEFLADIMHDSVCASRLSHLRLQTQQVVDELGRIKDLLESMLTDRLRELNARRRDLDTLERKAVEEMLREDKEYQSLASANLEQVINPPEVSQHSAPASENGTSSETDVDAETFEKLHFIHNDESASSSSTTDVVA